MNTNPDRDQVIVIHPPISGESQAIADAIQDHEVTPIPAADGLPLTPEPASETSRRGPAPIQPVQNRAFGLDAYRGLFLLLMTFSMTVPLREGILPEWMSHMQYPPPGTFVNRAGLTWPDLIFPAFLFSMCAAIPIANALRLKNGMPYPAIIWTAVKRFVVLYIFALIIGHSLPVWTQDYTKRGNWIAILGFLACWPIFTRRPPSWSEDGFSRIKLLGWVAGIAVLFALPLAWGSTFSIDRKDGIIHALAFVSLVTTVLWLFTRKSPLGRLVVFGAAIALKLASDLELPGSGLLYRVEAPLFFKIWMIELLIIAVPATFAGDLIVRWMQTRDEGEAPSWTPIRLVGVAILCLSLVVVAVVGFYLRYSYATAAGFALLGGLGLLLTARPATDREKTLTSLLRWAAVLLIAGALIDALGPTIRKDPQSLSYLIVTAGTSLALLIVLMVWVDVLKLAPRSTRVLVEVGQNALLAYVAFTMFFNNIGWLTGFGEWQYASRTGAIIGGLVFTAAVAALTAGTTRNRIFWKI